MDLIDVIWSGTFIVFCLQISKREESYEKKKSELKKKNRFQIRFFLLSCE